MEMLNQHHSTGWPNAFNKFYSTTLIDVESRVEFVWPPRLTAYNSTMLDAVEFVCWDLKQRNKVLEEPCDTINPSRSG